MYQFIKHEESTHKRLKLLLQNDVMVSFKSLKDVTYSCKRLGHSPTIGEISSVKWRKVGRSRLLKMCFRRLLCVRIKINQP